MSRIPRETFRKGARANPQALHSVVLAVKQNNLDLLEKEVEERSTPGSAKYQKWMTYEEVGTLTSNLQGAQEVTAWLTAHGANVVWTTNRQEYIKAEAPISLWEELLSAEFYEFQDHSRSVKSGNRDKKIHRADAYTIPAHLKDHLAAVFYTVQTPPEMRQRHHVADENAQAPQPKSFRTDFTVTRFGKVKPMASSGDVTVEFLNEYYLISNNTGSAAQRQGVFETSQEYFSPTDLTTFQNLYDLPVQSAQAPFGYTTTNCISNSCYEGNLDIQYIMGLAQQTTSIYWYTDNSDPQDDPFVDWAVAVANSTNPPLVNSISWGSIEQANNVDTLDTFNTEATKLAGMGVTTMVSSGDDGVAADGQYCNYVSSTYMYPTMWSGTPWYGNGYFPSFPATSPYVTAVGATMGPNYGNDEVACEADEGGVITTGGGFSSHFPTPSWQQNAVNAYFAGLGSGNTPASGYNPNGRGFPDISLIGVSYQVVVQNQLLSLFGTSASAPVLAAMVSLINAARAAKGMASVGFINPTLYAYGQTNTYGPGGTSLDVYNDVVTGDNKCTSGTPLICCKSGFYATDGWDPVTGFGSIFYPNLGIMFGLDYTYVTPNINNHNAAAAGARLGSAAFVGVVVAAVALLVQGYVF